MLEQSCPEKGLKSCTLANMLINLAFMTSLLSVPANLYLAFEPAFKLLPMSRTFILASYVHTG